MGAVKAGEGGGEEEEGEEEGGGILREVYGREEGKQQDGKDRQERENGQKLEKRNEKPVNGKKGNAGNGTSRRKDVEEKSDIKDAEESIWQEEYITVRNERKQMGRRR